MRYPVIIIGAGPSGLSIAHYLQKMGIEFIIFEKGEIGNSWRTQRWENMVLNTPNTMNSLPGMDIADSEGFITAKEFLVKLEEYAEEGKFNIAEHSMVKKVQKDSYKSGEFFVEVDVAGETKTYKSSIVIAASGAHIQKVTPEFSIKVPSRILQLHSSEYKSISTLNEGAILVVGSGQSGMQITRELIGKGRKVFLSTSKVGRIPRKYKGRDIENWLQEIGYYSEEIKDNSHLHKLDLVQPQIEVIDEKGISLGWEYFIKNGVELIGTLKDVNENHAFLDKNVKDNINYGTKYLINIKSMIDKHIDGIGLHYDETSSNESKKRNIIKEFDNDFIDFADKNITNIIWATGLKANDNYLNKNKYNRYMRSSHRKNEAHLDGLYFLGTPFQRTRKSGIILGIVEDSKFVAEAIKDKLQS